MHLIFEKTSGRFRSNCNILTLAWMPYYNEVKFRQALFEYHQRQLLTQGSNQISHEDQLGYEDDHRDNSTGLIHQRLSNSSAPNVRSNGCQHRTGNNDDHALLLPLNHDTNCPINIDEFMLRKNLNGRLIELQQRYLSLKSKIDNNNKAKSSPASKTIDNNNPTTKQSNGLVATQYIEQEYGLLGDFGWLVIGNIGRIVGISLTSVVAPPIEPETVARIKLNKSDPDKTTKKIQQNKKKGDNQIVDVDSQPDLIELTDPHNDNNDNCNISEEHKSKTRNSHYAQDNRKFQYEQLRPDKKSARNNYNLRGHLDEVIISKWNELYQKLATVDVKGNVLIWCKLKEKFTIQTPFYNRTRSVADFQWSHDGKTALICYTDSFILVGSSTGHRHWHSMLNLDDYHITCGSWSPNDEQILLGVSNGNIVVIDLPNSDLTELILSTVNIRAISWSNSNMSLAQFDQHQATRQFPIANKSIKTNLQLVNEIRQENQNFVNNDEENNNNYTSDNYPNETVNQYNSPNDHNDSNDISRTRSSTGNIVNQRRLSRDCSVFSRYRFCSQPPCQLRPNSMRNTQLPSHNNRATNRDNTKPGENLSMTRFRTNPTSSSRNSCPNILAVDYANNTIELFKHGLNDPKPRTIQVNLESYIMQWSSDGQVLAVAGFNIHTMAPSVSCIRCLYLNTIKFYNRRGDLIHERALRYTRYPITAFTWAHNNERVFIATGPRLHCAKVFLGVPKLSLLAMSCIGKYTRLARKSDVWKSLATTGLYSVNTIDWQSKNCPINLWQVYKQFMERTSLIREQNCQASLVPNFNVNSNDANGDNCTNVALISSSTSSGFNSSSSTASNRLVSSSSQTSSEPEQQSQSDDMPIYHYNCNIYIHNLPLKLRLQIDGKFCSETIKQPFEACFTPSDIIWNVPNNNHRVYCTLVCYTSDRNLGPSAAYQYNNIHQDNQRYNNQHPTVDHEAKSNQGNHHRHQTNNTNNVSSDQFKIFVLYMEFAGSYIPILRARRVGVLKPEFVIFDPHNSEVDGRMVAGRQHKVADISHRKDKGSILNGDMLMVRKRLDDHRNQKVDMSMLAHDCSGLHETTSGNNEFLYPRPSSSFGLARASVVDDRSCSFDANYNNNTSVTTRYSNREEKLADLMQKRSHHQEPLPPMPNSSHEAYLNYMNWLNEGRQLEPKTTSTPVDATTSSAYHSKNKKLYNQLQGLGKIPVLIDDQSPESTHLTEKRDLIRIKSNIWGTKFKILNESNSMIRNRSVLGTLVYKASLLHLQPRQILLNMKDMSNYCTLCALHHHIPNSSNHKQSRSPFHNDRNEDNRNGSCRKKSNDNQTICLLDAPIDYDLSKNCANIKKIKLHHKDTNKRQSTPKKSNTQAGSSSKCPNEKIVLAVGDSLRIAPRCDSNQNFKYEMRSRNDKHSNHPRSALSDYLKDLTSLTSDTTGTGSENLISNQSNIEGEPIGLKNELITTKSKSVSDSSEKMLLLGFDKANKFRVAMTDSPQPPPAPKRASSLHGSRSVLCEQRSSEKHRVQEKEALASDKTLKSIKDITQMIVDLSERSKLDDQPELAGSSGGELVERTDDLPSPNKLIKSASGTPKSPLISPILSSANYIPPDTPIHRPRHRPAHNLVMDDLGVLANYSQGFTQSANSTPVRRRPRQNNCGANKHRLNDYYSYTNSLITQSLSSNQERTVLPDPPPSEPLRSRLSSSARRFFDDSMRSLSLNSRTNTPRTFAGNFITNSDVEPEESEPLVRHSRNLIKRLQLTPKKLEMTQYLSNFGRSHSAINTPSLTTIETVAARQSNDLMKLFNTRIRNHITQRFGSSSSRNNEKNDTTDNSDNDDNSERHKNRLGRASKVQADRSTRSRERAKSVVDINKASNRLLNNNIYGYGELCDSSGLISSDQLADSSRGSSSSSETGSDLDQSDVEYAKNESTNARSRSKNQQINRKHIIEPSRKDVDKNKSKTQLNADRMNILRRFHSLSKLAENDLPSSSNCDLINNQMRTQKHKANKFQDQSGQSSSKSFRSKKYRKKSICNQANCCCSRHLQLKNRPPLWNEVSQVYQLDFGGRVTQESAKNLQIDFEGHLALQFGRLDHCTYTLDYKYPFNAVQAMSIALASLTQRLK